MDLFIYTSLTHISIRFRLVSQPNKELKLYSAQLFNATDISFITFGIILPPKLRGKISTNSQMNPTTLDENQNSEVCAIKILLHSGANASIIHKDVLYKRHQILKDKKK